jgi:hypothetical protein
MSTVYWIANLDGSWATTTNWSTGSVPVSNDIVIFDSRHNGNVTGGLNQTAVDLDSLHIMAGNTSQIGNNESDPLIISADSVRHYGSGTLFYQDGDGTTDLIRINSPNMVKAAWLSGTLGYVAAIDGSIILNVSGSLSVGYLLVALPQNTPPLELYGSGSVIQASMLGGSVVSESLVGTMRMVSGEYTHGKVDAIIAINGPSLVQAGGVFTFNAQGTMSNAIIMGGHLELAATPVPKTITNLSVFPGATCNAPEDIVTITAGGALIDRGLVG